MADYRPVDDAFPLVQDLSPFIDLSRFGKDADVDEVHATVKASALAAADSPPSRPGWLPSDWQGDCCPATMEREAIRQWFEWTVLGLEGSERCLEEDYRDDDRRNPNSVFHCAGNDAYRDAHKLIEILRTEGMGNLPYRERGNFSASETAEELRKLRDLVCVDPGLASPQDEAAKPEGKAGKPAGGKESDTSHSPDFRSVRWFGEVYGFTANQAPVVKCLYENWQNGTPDVGDETLLSAVDPESPPLRLSTLFRDHPAWNTLIVSGGTKGTKRLAEENTKGA